ncbi:MAG: hypothetical protein ACE5H9_21635 [Anaerolineae bacterium]
MSDISNNNGGDAPAWVARMLDRYQAAVAHGFILHFNTGDYVSPEAQEPLTTYLARILAGRQVVAIYSRDRGITFPTETMRRQALDLLGLATREEKPDDPALAALRAIGAAAPATQQDLPRSPSEALPLLDRLLRASSLNGEDPADGGKVSAVIIEGTEFIVPDADLATMSADDRTALATIARWGRDPEIVAAGNPVFLVTGNLAALHRGLRAASNRYEAIEVPLPDIETRRRFIERYLEERGTGFSVSRWPDCGDRRQCHRRPVASSRRGHLAPG